MTEALEQRLRAVLDPIESWREDAPATRSDYDMNPGTLPFVDGPLRHAAVLVAIVPRPEGATVILTRRADTLTSHTGQVAFPGGRLDPGETALEAALREAEEEIGLDPGRVRPIGLGDTYETGSRFVVTPVVAMVDLPFHLTLSPDEVAEAFETPLDFLMDAANHRREALMFKGSERFFWAMPWDDAGTERYIWGATAGMIRALSLRFKAAAA